MIPPTAVMMAAAHILTKQEYLGSDGDIMERSSYRPARLREVARLAWDLAAAVAATKPQDEV